MDREFFQVFMRGEGTKDYEIYLNTTALLNCQKDYPQLCSSTW
jgi:tryptophan 2,3-dioxygenase